MTSLMELPTSDTPYDRNAIAIAAGADSRILSPGGNSLITAIPAASDGTENDVDGSLSRKLAFSNVKSKPAAKRSPKRSSSKRQHPGNTSVLASPEVITSNSKKSKGRVSFGSNETKLYHPGDVVSTKKRKQVDDSEAEPVLKRRETSPVQPAPAGGGGAGAKKGTKRPVSPLESPLAGAGNAAKKARRVPPIPMSIHQSLREGNLGGSLLEIANHNGGQYEDDDEPMHDESDSEPEYRPSGYVTSPVLASNPLMDRMGQGGEGGGNRVFPPAGQTMLLNNMIANTGNMITTMARDASETATFRSGNSNGPIPTFLEYMLGDTDTEEVVRKIISGADEKERKKAEEEVKKREREREERHAAVQREAQEQQQQEVAAAAAAKTTTTTTVGGGGAFQFGGAAAATTTAAPTTTTTTTSTTSTAPPSFQFGGAAPIAATAPAPVARVSSLSSAMTFGANPAPAKSTRSSRRKGKKK
ncbi:hypothetical protein TrLO_g6883 [Triparma laevis f. longispina]|uniref:Uncharacterized protein n=1 Tax=Triparma laevis f. longispina TaxID=1714387 RepID=A0A9W7C361_9STRA|nr:hypothetical protein TrLO_g6883 [Triparma laevis f. longispina]